jgi:hypothetical protein
MCKNSSTKPNTYKMDSLEHEYLVTKQSFNKAFDRCMEKHAYIELITPLGVDTSREELELKQISNVAKLLFRATMTRKKRYLASL